MVEIEQPAISANKSDVHQPHISQKPLSIHSSNESIDPDTESASSSPTDSILLKQNLKRKHRASK